MTPWQKRATPLIQRMAEDMKIRNLAQKTIDAYMCSDDWFSRLATIGSAG